MYHTVKLVALGFIVLFSMMAINYARDTAYMLHGIIIMLVSAGLFLVTLRRTGDPAPAIPQTEYFDSVIRAGVIATAF